MDAVSIRVPYKNLKHEEELAGFERIRSHNHASSLADGGGSPSDSHPPQKHCRLMTLILSCTVAAEVQFGWALQLSILTPYIQVIITGFSADIGHLLGDTKEHCSTFKGTRTRAAAVFIIGFWMLDLASNTVLGPARALLADFSGGFRF